MKKGVKTMYDDFDTQIQSDELIPEEYDSWVRVCAQKLKRNLSPKISPKTR